MTMKTLKAIWKKISELGLTTTHFSLSNQSILYCNKIAAIIFINILLNILLFFLIGLYSYLYIYSLFLIFLIPVFFLNYFRFPTSASFYLVLFCNVGTFLLCSITGKESGNYMFFIDVILLNFFIFNFSQRKFILYNFFITGIFMIILEVTNYSLLLDKNLSIYDQGRIFQVGLLSTGIFMFFCIYNIINIRNKMEMAVSEEEDTLRLILNYSPLGIVLLNESRKIVSCNINFKNIFSKIGIFEITIGKDFIEYIPENEKANFNHYLILAEKGSVIQVEKNFKNEYTSYWFDITVSAIKTEEIQNKIVITLVDITDRKELEIESQIAREKAVAVNQNKSQFLSTISNQISKIMDDVNISLKNLSDKNPRIDQILVLDKLNRSSETLNRLISGILDYTAIESGNLHRGDTRLDLKTELYNIRDLFIERMQEKGNILIFIVDEEIPKYVRAEAAWIRQIISHLLKNSLNYTENGRVTFSSSILKNNNDKILIRFSIADTGRGISKKALRQIIDNFREPEIYYMKNKTSFRLGFTVVKRLLALFNSHIYIESEIGKGSNVYFSIEFLKINSNEIEFTSGW